MLTHSLKHRSLSFVIDLATYQILYRVFAVLSDQHSCLRWYAIQRMRPYVLLFVLLLLKIRSVCDRGPEGIACLNYTFN